MGEEFSESGYFVVRLAIVLVAVGHDQYLGRNLGEAIQDAGFAKIGRAARPYGPHGVGRQKRHHGLRNVGQHRRHAVTRLDAPLAQPGGHGRHLVFQGGPGYFGEYLPLRLKHHRRVLIGPVPENMLGVVEPGAGKPLRADHILALAPQHLEVGVVRFDVEVLPQAFPEVLHIVDRPFPQIVVVTKVEAFLDKKPTHIVLKVGLFGESPARLPERKRRGGRIHAVQGIGYLRPSQRTD